MKKSVWRLVLIAIVSMFVFVTASYAYAQDADESPTDIIGKIRAQLTCFGADKNPNGCIELAEGQILRRSKHPKEFITGRRIGDKEEVWVYFTSPETDEENPDDTKAYVGKSYLVKVKLGSLSIADQSTWVPSLQQVRDPGKSPNDPILSTRFPYFFLTLYAYLERYSWSFGPSTNVLLGIPRSRTLPDIELIYEKVKGGIYLIQEMRLRKFGLERRFTFEDYREIQSDTYRPLEVDVSIKGEEGADVIRFNAWCFSEPNKNIVRVFQESYLGRVRMIMPDPDAEGVLAKVP